jgi:hypothetical protein
MTRNASNYIFYKSKLLWNFEGDFEKFMFI